MHRFRAGGRPLVASSTTLLASAPQASAADVVPYRSVCPNPAPRHPAPRAARDAQGDVGREGGAGPPHASSDREHTSSSAATNPAGRSGLAAVAGRLPALLALLILALAPSPPTSAAEPATAAAARTRPSIVLVLTDDMEVSLVQHMPNVRSLIVRQGATFERAYFNDPLCCPSRATILTGKYAHNTGLTTNSHVLFHEAGLQNQTFALWLQAAGYRTGLIGKYLNGYPDPQPATYVPPGWTYWAGRIGGDADKYDYVLNENGALESYGSTPKDYATDVYRDKALRFVDKAVADGVPFFLELSMHSPHRPATPAPRHTGALPGLTAPRPPSFNEADVGDKPLYIRQRSPFSADSIARIDSEYRDRARTLQSVDEMVEAIVQALDENGRLADTYLVFGSDNGWLQGQHRIAGAKGPPYEDVIRMPLYVRGPGIAPGTVIQDLVGNVDLAPTFAEWAGAEVPDDIDGRSLAPLLRARASPEPEGGREAYPMMYAPRLGVPGWRGIRTRRYSYVEYDTGETELYDMSVDPHQLDNRADRAGTADRILLAKLAARTAVLARCKARVCRLLEDAALVEP